MEAVSATVTRVHVKLMRYERSAGTGEFSIPEERGRTRKSAEEFLAEIGKALKR